jgi:hypothetical protein
VTVTVVGVMERTRRGRAKTRARAMRSVCITR